MIETILGILVLLAASVERLAEVVKPLYLKIKKLITKKEYAECDKSEKYIISIVIGVILGLVSGVNLGIAGVPITVQQIGAGLIASLGSNFIHTLVTLFTAFKDQAETIKTDKVA
jgi:hypothetical protein